MKVMLLNFIFFFTVSEVLDRLYQHFGGYCAVCLNYMVSHQVVFLLFRQSNGNIYRYNVVYIQQCYHYCKKTFESTPL